MKSVSLYWYGDSLLWDQLCRYAIPCIWQYTRHHYKWIFIEREIYFNKMSISSFTIIDKIEIALHVWDSWGLQCFHRELMWDAPHCFLMHFWFDIFFIKLWKKFGQRMCYFQVLTFNVKWCFLFSLLLFVVFLNLLSLSLLLFIFEYRLCNVRLYTGVYSISTGIVTILWSKLKCDSKFSLRPGQVFSFGFDCKKLSCFVFITFD